MRHAPSSVAGTLLKVWPAVIAAGYLPSPASSGGGGALPGGELLMTDSGRKTTPVLASMMGVADKESCRPSPCGQAEATLWLNASAP